MPPFVRCLVLLLGVTLAGCVSSKEPLLGSDSRILPVALNQSFDTYERDRPTDPWQKNDKPTGFAADSSLVVHELDATNKPKDQARYTFHAFGPGRFLAQAKLKPEEPYSYAVVEVANGEVLVTALSCKTIDQQAFRREGGSIKENVCDLSTASDPLALLRKLAANPTGPQVRYVPVAK